MIRLEIDENNKHVLRVTASYFLALAGDVSATITDEVTQRTVATGKTEADAEQIKQVVTEAVQAAGGVPVAQVHDEVIFEAALDPHDAIGFHSPDEAPSAASVFGGADPKPVPSTVGAEASLTALGATQAVILPFPPPPAPGALAPTPEAAAPVPTAPAAPLSPAPAASAPQVELDKDGLPWDGRIHSESRSKVVAGTWKYKRGVDPRLVEEVEAELRAVMGVPAPEPSVPVAAAPASTLGTTPPPPAVPAGAPVPSGPTFPSLMLKISKAVAEGRTTQVAVVETVKACGLENLPALAHRPDLVANVDAAIDALLAGVAL